MSASEPSVRPLRVLIAGGGTGGHLFPGVALAEEVLAHGGEVTFVGTKRGIEARVIPALGWPLELVDVAGIKGRGLRGALAGVSRLPRAWWQSRSILRRVRPDVVVGVGGYASGPLVATAALCCTPAVILEQNSVPGLTNRILGRLVRKIFGAFERARAYFPSTRYVVAGNPIRRQLLDRIATGDRETRSAREVQRAPRLLVFGGSQGARAVNEAVLAAVPSLLGGHPDLEILHQTGQATAAEVEAAYAALGLGAPRVRVVSFIDDMASAYAWADLAVCRAGASSIAELSAVGLPALLVPFPHAADNHQEHNARELEACRAARVLLEPELGARLVPEIDALLADPAALAAMAGAMRHAARPDAAADVYRALCKLVPERARGPRRASA